jgi:hypothetical protein
VVVVYWSIPDEESFLLRLFLPIQKSRPDGFGRRLMKKPVLMLFVVGLVLYLTPASSHAIFSIELKNGRKILAENYRTEGTSMILYLKSGELKVLREEVKSILELKEEGEEQKEKKTEGVKEEKGDTPKKIESPKSAKDPTFRKQDIDGYLKRKAEIGGRLEKAKAVYFDATDRTGKEKARETMISISREMFSLEEEVMNRNKGVLPDWWKEN